MKLVAINQKLEKFLETCLVNYLNDETTLIFITYLFLIKYIRLSSKVAMRVVVTLKYRCLFQVPTYKNNKMLF